MVIAASAALTPEQRRIVEYGDGPLVVIAGAGTGKTRVIIERVRWLLETKGEGTRDAQGGCLREPHRRVRTPSRRPQRTRGHLASGTPATDPRRPTGTAPSTGRSSPEQILVLTYNVKAAKELQTRLDDAVGPATRARMTVSNFHSFCNRVLTESAADAGLPPNPDVLDGVGQVLLLRDIRPQLP